MATLKTAERISASAAVTYAPPDSPPAPPQKIAHVITRLLLSGAEENTMATCLHQAGCGHSVTLIHGPNADPSWKERFGDRMSFVSMDKLVHPISPATDVSAIAELRRIFGRLRPDVVHTHGSKAGIVGRIAAASSGVPLVVHTIHIAPFLAVGRSKRLLYLGAERLCASLSDLLIAVSRGMQQAFVEEGVGAGVPIPIIHSGMPIDRFVAATPPADWRGRIGGWSGADRPQILLKVASFEPRKRQHALIRALAPGLRMRPGVCLLLAGDGPDRGRCEQEVEALGLSDQIRFLGHDPRPWELVALADVAVHAAEREGLPRTAVQAIAGGRPLVVSWLPGIEEIIEDGVNGLVADPDDLANLATRLFALLDSPDELASLKLGAASTDVSSWAEHKMGERIDRAYAGARTRGFMPARIKGVEFFGLPGAGKTTIANELQSLLRCSRGNVHFSGDVMGDELPLVRRSLKRFGLLARAFARHPFDLTAAAAGLTPGRSSLRDRAKTRWNFLSVLAMQLRAGRRELLLSDQGLAQAVWSARVQHGSSAAPAAHWFPRTGDWLETTLFVRIDAPAAVARDRLSRRVRLTSRFQRPECRDNQPLWEAGVRMLESLDSELEEALSRRGLSNRMLRIDSAVATSAKSAARLIADYVRQLEEVAGEAA